MFCLWCKEWDSIHAFTALQTPPGQSHRCVTVFKHGGPSGCKKLSAPLMVVMAADGERLVQRAEDAV